MREKQVIKSKVPSKSSILGAKKLSSKKPLHPALIEKPPVAAKSNQFKRKSNTKRLTQSVAEDSTLKKARHYRPGTKALREIRKYQRGTDLLLNRAPFQRVVREVLSGLTPEVFRFQSSALECLQTAAEAFVIQVFEDSVLAMIHAKRITLMVRDIQFIRRLRGI